MAEVEKLMESTSDDSLWSILLKQLLILESHINEELKSDTVNKVLKDKLDKESLPNLSFSFNCEISLLIKQINHLVKDFEEEEFGFSKYDEETDGGHMREAFIKYKSNLAQEIFSLINRIRS